MADMKVVIIAVIGWACHLVAAQEKVCSDFCSSLGLLQTNPGGSCNDIYEINKASRGVSGNYWISTTTGVHQVYCDMELECGGHKGGWMRIADFDTSRGDDCPTGWARITTPVTSCIAPSSTAGCYSTNFFTQNAPFSKVCGMAIGYQSRTTAAFDSVFFTSRSINGPYVDGISITYGTPRKHIWTYAIGFSDRGGNQIQCPCAQSTTAGALPPSFVHENYYCESGRSSFDVSAGSEEVAGVYVNDPVWDGDGCSDVNSCCADPSLPWFYRQIPLTATEEPVEVRICRDQDSNDEDVLVREFQLYIRA